MSSDIDEKSIKQCLDNIEKSVKDKEGAAVPAELERLKTVLIRGDGQRVYAANSGAYNIIVDVLRTFQKDRDVLNAALKTVTTLMSGQPDLLDEAGIQIQMELLEEDPSVSTQQLLMRWIKACCVKSETNRQKIFNANVLDKMKKLLQNKDITENEVKDICGVLRALTLNDDAKIEYGRSIEHARVIASDTLCSLIAMFEKFKSNKSVAGDVMLTLAVLIVRNEFCQKVEDAGGLKLILDVMTRFPDEEKLNWQALKLLKALAGNDDVKVHIVTSGAAPLIITLLNGTKKEPMAAAGLGCISALSLRSPHNAGIFYDCGAPTVILRLMRDHPDSLKVQQNGAWAIRNMSARNKNELKHFLDAGAEDLLALAMRKHGSKIEYDIKCALRDLGLSTEMKDHWIKDPKGKK